MSKINITRALKYLWFVIIMITNMATARLATNNVASWFFNETMPSKNVAVFFKYHQISKLNAQMK